MQLLSLAQNVFEARVQRLEKSGSFFPSPINPTTHPRPHTFLLGGKKLSPPKEEFSSLGMLEM